MAAPLVVACERCAHQDHKHCQGTPDGPEGKVCRCRQCFTQEIMAMAATALEGNNLASMRTALKAVYALQAQTIAQRQKKIRQAPGIAYCAECGKPVAIRRHPRPGQSVYCRKPSTCRWHAWAKRQRAAGQPVYQQYPAQTSDQAPSPARGRAHETNPADLWLATRAG